MVDFFFSTTEIFFTIVLLFSFIFVTNLDNIEKLEEAYDQSRQT
jgi:hypothetical protein